MKTYLITILYKNGKTTLTYTDDKPLKQFSKEVYDMYGDYYTLESHEVTNP